MLPFYTTKIQRLIRQYKTPILYSGSSIARAFASLVVGFFIAKYVSPEDLGIWATLNLFVTYSLFIQAGLINGLNLELPYAFGKGDVDLAKKMAGTVQTYTLFAALIILSIGLIFFFNIPTSNLKYKFGSIAITLFIILSFYQNFLLSTFRSNNSFLKLSVIQIIDTCVNLFSLALVAYYSYYGLIIKAVFVIFIYVLLLHFSRPIKVKFIWDKNSFIQLIKVGLPIFALAYLESFSSTIDKLLLLKFSSISDVGLYSFAFYAFSIFTLFSGSIASYVYPRMTYSYGQNNDKLILWNYVKKMTITLISIQLPLVLIGFFTIPNIIITYFPNYEYSIPAMRILLIAGLFKGSVIGANVLWSIKNWAYMIYYQVSYSGFIVTFTSISIFFSENRIEGVAFGVLIANILNFFTGIFFAYKATHQKLLSK